MTRSSYCLWLEGQIDRVWSAGSFDFPALSDTSIEGHAKTTKKLVTVKATRTGITCTEAGN